MTAFQSPIRYIFSVLCLTFFFCTIVFAQDKVDLEIKVQTASETARGGETFSYTVTVNNIGSAKATDVIMVQSEPKTTEFVSFVPNKGACEIIDIDPGRADRMLNCKFGDVESGESIIIAITLKIHDFGDISEDAKYVVYVLGDLEANSDKTTLTYIDVYPKEEEENKENNSAKISARLLPSKNIPPRVEIITPKVRNCYYSIS